MLHGKDRSWTTDLWWVWWTCRFHNTVKLLDDLNDRSFVKECGHIQHPMSSRQFWETTQLLCSRVRASWININNCSTSCDYMQLYFLQTAPHVSDDTLIHHQEHVQTVFTTSGTGRTVFAAVRWRGTTPPRQWTVANTVRPMPNVVITVWMCSWWWMMVSSEKCRAVCRKYIKSYVVASCWTVIDIDSQCTDPWTFSYMFWQELLVKYSMSKWIVKYIIYRTVHLLVLIEFVSHFVKPQVVCKMVNSLNIKQKRKPVWYYTGASISLAVCMLNIRIKRKKLTPNSMSVSLICAIIFN